MADLGEGGHSWPQRSALKDGLGPGAKASLGEEPHQAPAFESFDGDSYGGAVKAASSYGKGADPV